MTDSPTTLYLSSTVKETLRLLTMAALSLKPGDRVVDALPINPYGDVEAFDAAVARPLAGDVSANATASDHLTLLTVSSEDADLVMSVLDALDDGIAGGVPWPDLTLSEREAMKRLRTDLAHGDHL